MYLQVNEILKFEDYKEKKNSAIKKLFENFLMKKCGIGKPVYIG